MDTPDTPGAATAAATAKVPKKPRRLPPPPPLPLALPSIEHAAKPIVEKPCVVSLMQGVVEVRFD